MLFLQIGNWSRKARAIDRASRLEDESMIPDVLITLVCMVAIFIAIKFSIEYFSNRNNRGKN